TGEDASGVWAVYVSGDGTKPERMADSKYNATRQLVVFTTVHLSTYAVIYDGASANNTAGSAGSGGGCDTGAAALLAIGAAAAVAKKRRKG
ncbi:MAG: hypothetical protein LBS45_07740, partial [Synergistaceae bacterium]|nr:hypothetical protein [Synergistaceae bacterium]